jgi:hypothetical protein
MRMEVLHLIKADQVEALLARHLLARAHAFPRANLRVYRGRSDHAYISHHGAMPTDIDVVVVRERKNWKGARLVLCSER